jgi:hypothetical protein
MGSSGLGQRGEEERIEQGHGPGGLAGLPGRLGEMGQMANGLVKGKKK